MIDAESSIRQGEALTYLVRPNTLDAGVAIDGNWVCRAVLKDAAGDDAVNAWTVTDKRTHEDGEEYFVATLTKADTAPQAIGNYLWIIDVHNDSVSPPFSQEDHILVKISSEKLTV